MEKTVLDISDFFTIGTIDHFEGTNAIIITEDKQTLLWPIKNLPDDTREGEVVKLFLTTDKLETQNREQIVENLLNQILKK